MNHSPHLVSVHEAYTLAMLKANAALAEYSQAQVKAEQSMLAGDVQAALDAAVRHRRAALEAERKRAEFQKALQEEAGR